jgi:glucoamylase
MLAGLLASEGRPVSEARRVPYLPAAVLGNGALLATVSARGELERLFWPNVDGGQHLGELRLAASAGGALHWLDERPHGWEQEHLDESSVLSTRSGDVEIVDVVRPSEPVLARRIRVRGAERLAIYLRPWLDEAAHGQAIYVDPERDALVVYRRDTVLALTLDRPHEFTCGRSVRGDASSVLADLEDGRLDGWTVAHRDVEAALACGGDEATLVLAFGSTPDEALARLDDALAAGFDALREERQRHDRERIGSALASTADRLEPVYRRSLLVFDLVSDRETGGVIAAPELDPRFVESGGYGFVWARDLAFTVLGFLACGREDFATAGLRWLVRTQAPEGLWLQRHRTDGALAASWGLHQIDETGAVLFAFDAAWHELHDEELDRELWPAACRGADFLAGFLDPATGLPLPSVDLWSRARASMPTRRRPSSAAWSRLRGWRSGTSRSGPTAGSRPQPACATGSRPSSGARSTAATCARSASPSARGRARRCPRRTAAGCAIRTGRCGACVRSTSGSTRRFWDSPGRSARSTRAVRGCARRWTRSSPRSAPRAEG